ncbi:fused MFS/spermidine synthase [Candidatus Magnetaquicoccus inordinatus]|uniref:fused MFS/spermidine synthase n=1 Tax=Candidatus Magnetaquicoccus inordinatus TaxID=2496818 RepID=UPI00102C2175|nr:fused MFS/spermidine synthase [Candidatus Magnetaquicoccus inordinatus]
MLSARLLASLYGTTILLGAFLLFLLQPMSGKIILPWFGGSSSVWSSCLLFFQTLLLGGYLYAHASRRWLSPKIQSLLHFILLALALATLPVDFSSSWKPTGTEEPLPYILALLSVSIGLPYLVLAASSPLLQAWVAQQRQSTQVYRLFALSNAGSLLALLAYPFLIEPWSALQQQRLLWSLLFVLYALLCAVLAWHNGQQRSFVHQVRSQSVVPWRSMLLCLLLSLAPSLLLIAFTRLLTSDMAPIPLLWLLPLALYLFSFVLAFAQGDWYRRALFMPLLLLAMAILLLLPLTPSDSFSLSLTLAVLLLAVAILFLVCHSELALLRPGSEHLTQYYLVIALGGALGGVAATFVAPLLCVDACEYPVSLLLCGLVSLYAMWPNLHFSSVRMGKIFLYGVLLLFIVAAWQTVAEYVVLQRGLLFAVRNFYGILKVYEDPQLGFRKLLHGRIIHGGQFLAEEKRDIATTYYGTQSGVGRVLAVKGEQGGLRVGLVGLGVASLAAYGRSADYFRFYELDPQVLQVAERWFFHLARLPARQDVVVGDARLQLEREADNQFDLLVVDAFTGDAIPVHLLSLQALQLYFRHLREDGVLAIHLSNRYVELSWVVAGAAERLGVQARLFEDPGDAGLLRARSKWVVLARHDQIWRDERLAVGKEMVLPEGFRVWEDDYAPLLSVLLR